jgi:hypothetical protein
MKVAFCLHGNIGSLYTNKREYKFLNDVDYRIGHHHYQKHIFDINPHVDVFIHSWSCNYKNEICETYTPKKYLFEKQKTFNAKWSDEIGTKRKEVSLSRWYSAMESVRLKREYEEANNFKYDYVISIRFDLVFLKDLDFSLFKDNSLLYVPFNKNFMTHNPRIMDYFFFSNSQNMDLYIGGLYNFISPRSEKLGSLGKINSHTDSMVFAKKCNLQVAMIEDYKEPEDIIIARAYYDDCEYKGKNWKGVGNLKTLYYYPRGIHGNRF